MNLKDSYTFPRTYECLGSLVEAKIFTTLEPYNGYWQVSISPNELHKTSLVFHE